MKKLALTFLTFVLVTAVNAQGTPQPGNCVDITPKFTLEKLLPAGGIKFTDITTTNLTDQLTYAWDFGNGNTSSEENPFMMFDNEADYTIQLVVSNQNGCTSTYTEVVNWSYNGN